MKHMLRCVTIRAAPIDRGDDTARVRFVDTDEATAHQGTAAESAQKPHIHKTPSDLGTFSAVSTKSRNPSLADQSVTQSQFGGPSRRCGPTSAVQSCGPA